MGCPCHVADNATSKATQSFVKAGNNFNLSYYKISHCFKFFQKRTKHNEIITVCQTLQQYVKVTQNYQTIWEVHSSNPNQPMVIAYQHFQKQLFHKRIRNQATMSKFLLVMILQNTNQNLSHYFQKREVSQTIQSHPVYGLVYLHPLNQNQISYNQKMKL